MKICAIADIHSLQHHLAIPSDCELLICAGDLTEYGTDGEMKQFCKWLAAQPSRYKIAIAGNHDHCLAQKSVYWKEEFAQQEITYLHNQSIEIEGLKIYGSPYIPTSGQWSFQKEPDELIPHWQEIPSSCHILITHGPPFGILDLFKGEHIGDKALYDSCQTKLPSYHFFGHVHACSGSLESTLTNYINCSCKRFLNKGTFSPQIWQVDHE